MKNFTILNKRTGEYLTLNINNVYIINENKQLININKQHIIFDSINEIYGTNQEQESQLFLEYLELNDIKRTLKNKIDLNSQIAFYVSTGDKEWDGTPTQDLYLTSNDIKVFSGKEFKKDMGDSICHYQELTFNCQYDLKLYISALTSVVLSEEQLRVLYPNYRIDNVKEIKEIINDKKELLEIFKDDSEKVAKQLKDIEILENYIKEGKTLIYNTYTKRLINSFKYNKFIESQYKDYAIESEKICKELKEKFGINLDSYALIKLYRNGYKIVKARK